MGSSSWVRDERKTVKQELDEHYGAGRDGTNHIVKSRVYGGAYYAVCRSFNNDGVVFAIAAPYETYHEGSGFYRTNYILAKDQDESCGPAQYDFPVKWLDELSEPVNEYSRIWREHVRGLARPKRGPLKDGDVIQFKEPITFVGGQEHDRFQVFRLGRGGRKLRFRAVDKDGLYASFSWCRLSRDVLRYREWEVVS